MKATMIGVAPPSPGAVAPPPQMPGGAPAPAGFAPTGPMAMGGPAPTDAVNPLGGTMVATPGTLGTASAGIGAVASAGFAVGPKETPAEPPLDATQASARAYEAPVQPQGAPGGWNAPAPAAGGYAAPQGGPAPGYYGQTPAPGAGYGGIQPVAPYGGAMVSGAQPGYPMAGPMTPHGPIGKTRSPVMVVVLTYATCGIYGLIAMLSMLSELKAFRQKDDINPILFLVPIVQLLELIKLPAKVLEAKRMAGVPNAQEPNVILYVLLGLFFIPADLNEVWQAAQARQGMGALPPAGM